MSTRKAKLKVRVYDVVARAVEEGVSYGWTRAYKYTDKPTVEHIKEQIYQAVMNDLCDVVDFDP